VETEISAMPPMNDEQAYREPDAWELLAKYFRRSNLLLTTLSLFTAVLYSGTLFFPFVWDDGPQIVDNPLIRSWHTLSRVFVSDLWYHSARRQVYYRPLFVAWSILNYAVEGLRPWGWHLGAILLHIGATLAVFWLLRRLGLEYWTAGLATLIFAFHPVHIECVAWISAASDSMVTMFAALAFGAFLKARDPDSARKSAWHAASLVLLACALLSKEMAVSFTALVGIYVWLSSSRTEKRPAEKLRDALVAMVPYAAVTLCYVILRRFALMHSASQFDIQHGWADMAFTLPYIVAFYLNKLMVPLGLTGLYYTPYVTTKIVSQFLLPVLALSATAGLIYFWARKTGDWVVAFAGCWLLIGLAPVLYIRAFGNGDFVRDRYMYLPSIGFAILAAMGLRRLPSIKGWSAKAVQGCAVLVLCAGYACASIAQQVYWADDLMVLLRGQSLYPGNPSTMVGLAKEYSKGGAHDRAIELAESVVRDHPDYGYGPLTLAEVYIHAGRFKEGRVWLDRVTPEYAKSEVGMAGVAGLYGQMGDYERALALCSEILQKEPSLYSALYNCGNIHLVEGQYKEAEQLLSRAVQLVPEQAGPKHFLGRALLQDGRSAEARPYLLEAVLMDPKVWDYHYWLAESFEESGNISAARTEYRQTLRLNPDSEEAKIRLAALEAK